MDLEKIKQKKSFKELLEFSIINIDKPSGPTSFQVDLFVKKALGLKKTSHFGTLDPRVHGVLPVALDRACRLSDYFMHKDKTYVGVMHLHSDISEEELKKEMEKFTGKIMQKPPVKSRVKREEREREVKKFEILEINGREVLFLAEVEAGTYIRKICSDLGEKIGGAHMTELRRVKAGIFSEDESLVNLYDFEKVVEDFKNGKEEKLREILIPADFAIKEILQTVQVKEKSVKQLLTGKPLMKQDFVGNLPDSEKFAVFFKERFIEVAKKVKEGEIIARPEFVLN